MKKFFLIWIFNVILTNNLYASTPLWIFTPLTPTTISIDAFEIKFIDYLITNKSSITHNISIQPFPFKVIDAGPFSCGEEFTLEPNKSCVLSFIVRGQFLKNSFRGGPVLCETGIPELCYKPSQKDILTVIFAGIGG